MELRSTQKKQKLRTPLPSRPTILSTKNQIKETASKLTQSSGQTPSTSALTYQEVSINTRCSGTGMITRFYPTKEMQLQKLFIVDNIFNSFGTYIWYLFCIVKEPSKSLIIHPFFVETEVYK